MIQEAIGILVEGRDLDEGQAAEVMTDIMSGGATPAQIGAFITALRIKGETVSEITGLARIMRAHSLKVETSLKVVDSCGTGGDATGTFNISTGAALVAAAAGVVVAKHGNRAMSSRCGSADVLEGLGVRIDLDAAGVARCLDQVGIGFMFAPVFHPAMKYAGPPRKEIGIRTVFNILGPLTNPAGAAAQVLGVADAALVPKMAAVLLALGAERALVVHGADGLDEISLSAETTVCEVRGGEVITYTLNPAELGLARVDLAALKGGSLADNVKIITDVLSGASGAPRDAVLLNAGAVLLVAGVAADLRQGVKLAADAIDTGRARETLEHFVRLSQGLAGEAA
jgi:anthranilate phosphoribosyltransferase